MRHGTSCVLRAPSLRRKQKRRFYQSVLIAASPMRQIYLMFRGELTPDQMMGSARTSTESQFYGHLYAGLYAEALGDKTAALEAHLSSGGRAVFASADICTTWRACT